MNRVIVAGSIITDMSVVVEKHPSVGETPDKAGRPLIAVNVPFAVVKETDDPDVPIGTDESHTVRERYTLPFVAEAV